MQNNRHNKTTIEEYELGSSVPILLIVIAAVIVIGVAGGIVYKDHGHKSANLSSSTQATTKLITKSITSSSNQTTQAAQQHVQITQWGVEAPYSGSLQLSYTMSSDDTIATFSSSRLSALSSDCVGRGGSIERWASTDQVSNGYPATSSSPTATQAFASADPSAYAHIGNYYYAFAHDQAACGDPSTTSTIYSQTNNAVQALVSNLQTIPSDTSN